ncbi:recombinase family protein [Thioclava sp. GXIMD4215]|uniref:recombinase family protein n=1 Tax=Thioclava sp. GXIMD4215 TaxID=3131928 RepID=UPI0038735467
MNIGGGVKFYFSEDCDKSHEAAISLIRRIRRVARSQECSISFEGLRPLGRQPSEIMNRLSSLHRAGASIDVKLGDDCDLKLERAVPELLQVLSAIERQNTSQRTTRELRRAKASHSAYGRPLVMTPQRQVTAARMLAQGKRGMQILPVVRAMTGPPISQSAYYLWQKVWLAERKVSGQTAHCR